MDKQSLPQNPITSLQPAFKQIKQNSHLSSDHLVQGLVALQSFPFLHAKTAPQCLHASRASPTPKDASLSHVYSQSLLTCAAYHCSQDPFNPKGEIFGDRNA